MEKIGEYIQRIEIDSLWSGQKHIVWDLNRKVNILSGVNGVGKSTILNKVIVRLLLGEKDGSPVKPDVRLTYYPEDASTVRFDVIRSFDRPLIQSNLLEKLGDARVVTELDWQLYLLQRRFLDYQVNVGNRMINMLTSGEFGVKEKAQQAAQARTQFQDMVDDLFRETGKKLVRTSNEIRLEQFGEILVPYKLSSGEKQILVILLTVLVEDRQPYVLFMDEPEVSLHIEWQQKLISMIRQLNPNVQIILTTHSPAVIMNGWMDAVTEVTDITLS
ncbi:MAG: AAA family ATPase [Paraprevotella sp.]|nr:AAA family ATPase [Paraprevotella sp.]